jgi:hypothetical protein
MSLKRIVLCLAGIIVVVVCKNSFEKYSEDADRKTSRAVALALESQQVSNCVQQIPKILAEYDRLVADKQYWNASLHVRKCASLSGNAQLIAKADAADILERQAIIHNPKSTQREKANAMEVLVRDYPSQFSGLAPKIAEITNKLDASETKRIKAERRKNGVDIGMTMAEVQDSSWGKPQSINRSTYATHTREQWVYGNRNYLYFQNGVLTSIQN